MADFLKVTFHAVGVINDSDLFGSGEFTFKASVGGVPVGDATEFNAVEGTLIALDPTIWSLIVDVTSLNSVVVSFRGREVDLVSDDDIGSVTHTLKSPYRQGPLTHHTKFFRLIWSVELLADGTFGIHAPGTLFACRQAVGGVDFNTVAGTVGLLRGEIHPVRPTPTAGLPPRPAFPAGTAAAVPVGPDLGVVVTPTSAINLIPNPAVIPILAAADANATTAARLEFTFIRPGDLNFTPKDPRLVWSQTPLTGGVVAFVDAPNGTNVLINGVTVGQVLLEVRIKGVLLASYRALVDRVRPITCRFNILNGPSKSSIPRTAPTDVLDHLAITNIFLRALGVALVLDANPTRTHGAVATGTPGIFRIKVSAGTTRNIPVTGFQRSARLNFRPNVMNFAYVHSDANGNLGAASDFPASKAGGTITDNGTPSTSWISPTGILPDGASATQTMTLLNARQRPGFPTLFSMYVTDANGDPTVLAAQESYANTIAHELGHILNLGHRVDSVGSPFNDGLNYPPGENVMHFNNPFNVAQDWDIIQALAVRQSPLVPP